MKVSNLVNDKGNSAVNQFVITRNDKTVFQSYKTTIASVDVHGVTLDRDALDYSRTTSKHLYIFLRDFTPFQVSTRKDVEKLINAGDIVIGDLN